MALKGLVAKKFALINLRTKSALSKINLYEIEVIHEGVKSINSPRYYYYYAGVLISSTYNPRSNPLELSSYEFLEAHQLQAPLESN